MSWKMMLRASGISPVLYALLKLADRAGHNANVEVGYETRYAIYVHEDMTVHHPVGQAKFLEAPARRLVKDITDIVKERLKQGSTLSSAMWQGGRKLEVESVLLVPIDTGLLKSTAFTKLERLP